MEQALNKGPDQIKPSDKLWVTDVRDAVKLRMAKEGIGSTTPISIPTLLIKAVDEHPDHPALRFKANGVWETITYRQYKQQIDHMTKVFINLGLDQRYSVCILAFNCKEWIISEFAAIQAGGIACGIYQTNSPEAVHYILESSKAQIIVVDDLKQYEKVLKVKDRLENLKAVIQIEEPFGESQTWYHKWNDLMALNVDKEDDEFNRRLSEIAVNECCMLVYTSGTVGNPKGVMLSHDNLTFNGYNTFVNCLRGIQYAQESFVSYLPFSHAAAQIPDVFMALWSCGTVYFADKDALKGTLAETLKYARPTRFMAVPRVYEKMEQKLMEMEKNVGTIKKFLMNWAKTVTLDYYMKGQKSETLQYKLAKRLVSSKVKEALGFDNINSLHGGAAPISESTKTYFLSFDMPIFELYGMSEVTGTHVMSPMNELNLPSVGKTIESYETKIIEPDENGNGEILMRGRNAFMGYINDSEKTQEATDDEGWIHSGDVGQIDENGFLYITGRIKEIIITAGGENIPPVHVEGLVKKELPILSNVMLIGDKKKFLSMLVTLKTEMDPETTAPLDELLTETKLWMQELGLNYTKLSEVLAAGPDPKILKVIEDGIVRANKNAISNAQKVQKFAILPRDFSVANGELGPTLKLKRSYVIKMYQDIIDNFYK